MKKKTQKWCVKRKSVRAIPGQPNGWRFARGKYPPLLPPLVFDTLGQAQGYVDDHNNGTAIYRIVPQPKRRVRKRSEILFSIQNGLDRILVIR